MSLTPLEGRKSSAGHRAVVRNIVRMRSDNAITERLMAIKRYYSIEGRRVAIGSLLIDYLRWDYE